MRQTVYQKNCLNFPPTNTGKTDVLGSLRNRWLTFLTSFPKLKLALYLVLQALVMD